MKGKSWLIFLVSLAVILLLGACGPAKGAPESVKETPAVWMFKKGEGGSSTGDLYVKVHNKEAEKIASGVSIGQFQPSVSANKVVFADGDNNLYLWESGKEKIKIDSDVSVVSASFSEDGKKLHYTNSDDALYVYEEGKEKTKLAGDVSYYVLGEEEGLVFYLDHEDNLYKLPASGEKTKLASDVSFFRVSGDSSAVVYESTDNLMYAVRGAGEKHKLSSSDAGYAQISSDGDLITLTDEYNLDKGYGELYIYQWGKSEYEKTKISSDVQDHFISWDEKSVIYWNSDNDLYQYNIKSQEKTKLASGAEELHFSKDFELFAYLNEDQDLYVLELGKEAEKVASDIERVEIMDNKSVYFVDEDDQIYVKLLGKEKVKLELAAEEYNLTEQMLYYLAKDNKIGVVLPGKTEGALLLEQPDSYNRIYSRSGMLFEKLAKLDDIAGYWHIEEEDGYVYFEKTGEDKGIIHMYHMDQEETLEFRVDSAEEHKLHLAEPEEIGSSLAITLTSQDEIIFDEASEDSMVFKRSTKEALDKMKATIEADNKAILAMFDESIKALESENVDAYMATIDPDSYIYSSTLETMQYMFEAYDGIKYKIESTEFIERYPNEAIVRVVQLTTGESYDFYDNRTVADHTVVKGADGKWRVSETEYVDYEYLD